MTRHRTRALIASLAVAGSALITVPETVAAIGTGPTSCSIQSMSADKLTSDSSVTIAIAANASGAYDYAFVVDGTPGGTFSYQTDTDNWSIEVTRGWWDVGPTTQTVGINYYASGSDTPMCSFTLSLEDDTPTTSSEPPAPSGPTTCAATLSAEVFPEDLYTTVVVSYTVDVAGGYDYSLVVNGVEGERSSDSSTETQWTSEISRALAMGLGATSSIGSRMYQAGTDTMLCEYTVYFDAPPVATAPTVLPETGSTTTPLLLAGGLLVAVGAVLATRRRRTA